MRKYEQAWSTLEGVGQDVKNRISDSAYADIIQSLNDPTASGRNAWAVHDGAGQGDCPEDELPLR